MRKQVAAMVGVLSLAVATVGLAATVDPNSLLTEGYDSDNHNLVWGVADHPDSEEFEGTYDCSLETGTYNYEVGEDGKVMVLTDEGDAAVTYSEPDDEDDTTTESTVNYGETEGECDLTVTNVEGPQGQVNHGTVVSSFVHALKDAGVKAIGCYLRIIAQSDYGKGDQQVNVPDVEEGEEVDEGEEVIEEPETGSVDLTTHETTCGKPDHAGQGRPEGAGQGGPPEGKGKPEWAGPPEGVGQGRPEGAGEGRGRP